ncbi:hypothetical protein K2Z84_02180 [Candidatus Binatia bacterium]|jgi:hypothetical protein|nr:hypothetical protein [Candidatus Binatia bacterium]
MIRKFVSHSAGVLVAMLGVVLLDGSAHALTSCNGGITFTSDTTLADDYQLTGNGTCITVTNGAKLELNGHTITCSGCGASATAVSLSTGGKLYGKTSSSSASPGGIKAASGSSWNTAVTGPYGSPADLVKDVKIEAAAYGAVNIKDVTNSVFENCLYSCIYNTHGAGGGARIVRDNYIDGAVSGVTDLSGPSYAIYIRPSSAGATIENNYVRNWATNAIRVTSAHGYSTSIVDNVIGVGRTAATNAITHSTSGGGTTTIDGNLCGETGTDCPHPNPPFLLP